ncbi:hypothetical protein SCUP515_01164 [Seiridium cupressi]
MVVGAIENPVETYARVPPMPEDEIASSQGHQGDKTLAFLSTPSVPCNTAASCAKGQQCRGPSLQDIRDACADLSRGDDFDENEDIANDEEDESLAEILWHERPHAEKVAAFGPGQKKKEAKQQRIKIRLCGKSIWNYSSEKSMSRDGWLQFSIMTKDCDLRNAIQLCRNWDEFSEVNMLTTWQSFPAPNWVSWGDDRLTQQLHGLVSRAPRWCMASMCSISFYCCYLLTPIEGFFPYFQDFSAARTNKHLQVGARSSLRRQHDIVETRNIIVAHMKRNGPATPRFLQYCLMRAGDMLVVVREGKTGKVLTCPNEEHLFAYRVKQGLGRASKNEYEDILNIGPEYCAVADRLRRWRFGFDDYYDVWLWGYAPGRERIDTYNLLISELRNAWQITKPSDVYKHSNTSPLGLTALGTCVATLGGSPVMLEQRVANPNFRVHQVEAGEESIWDELWSSDTKFLYRDLSKGPQMMPASEADLAKMSPHMFYSAADAAEDAIIFPHKEGSKSWLFKEISNPISEMSDSPPAWMQFYCANFKTYISGDVVANDNPENEYNLYEDDDDIHWEDEEDDEILGDDDSPHESDVYSLGDNSDDGEKSDQRLPEGVSNLWKLPNIWADALGMIQVEAFVKSFHACDTETGGQDKYAEISEFLSKLQAHDNPTGSTSWFWYLVSILELLELRADYEAYNLDGFAPWLHAFIVQDLVGTFASQVLPECRSRTTFKYRPKSFWKEWQDILDRKEYFTDIYPMDRSIAARQIIAKLYPQGVIAPAYMEPVTDVIPGFA